MPLPKEAAEAIKNFLKNPTKKILLVTADDESTALDIILQQLKQSAKSHSTFDVVNNQKFDAMLSNISDVLIISGFVSQHRLENIYIKFHLDRWTNKIMFICPQSLLHPKLDPSIYFVPMKSNRPQKHLLAHVKSLSTTKAATSKVIPLPVTVSEKKTSGSISLRNHFLNQRLMTKDPFMMQMIADRAQQDETFTELLFKLLFASRHDKSLKIAAANAITILNYARISLSHLDLTGVDISDADLSNAILAFTNFSKANLTNVNLKQAYLYSTNFSQSIMEGVNFGEEAYIEHSHEVTAIAFSPNNQWLAIGGDKEIKIWHWPTKILVGTLDALGDVSSVAFSADSTILFAGTDNVLEAFGNRDRLGKFIEIWDLTTGRWLGGMKGHTADIYTIKCNPAGTLLASGGEDCHIRLWDISKPLQELAVYETHDLLQGHETVVTGLAFDSTGKIMISGSLDNTIIIWDMERRQIQRRIIANCSGVTSVSISPDNVYIVSAGQDYSIKLWKVDDGQLVHTFLGHQDHVNSVCFDHTGQYIASASFDYTIKLWSVQTRELLRTSQGHTRQLTRVCFSPDNQTLLSCGFDNNVRLWDLTANTFHNESEIFKKALISFNGNGQLVSIASHVNFYLLNTKSGAVVAKWQPSLQGVRPKATSSPLLEGVHMPVDISLSPDGQHVIWANWNDRNIHCANSRTGEVKYVLQGHTGSVLKAAYSPSGNQVVSIDEENSINFGDLITGQVLPIKDNNHQPTTICFSPDGKYFVWGTQSGHVKMFDIQAKKVKFSYPAHPSAVVCVAFSRDNRLLVSCSENNIKVVDLAGDLILQVDNPILEKSKITCMDICPKGQRLVTGCEKGMIYIWDLDSGSIFAQLNDPSENMFRVIFHPVNPNIFISAGSDGIVKLWENVRIANESRWSIRWQTNYSLYCQKVNLQDTHGLTAKNQQLLRQRGAIGKPATDNSAPQQEHISQTYNPPSHQSASETDDEKQLRLAMEMSLESTSDSAIKIPTEITNNLTNFLKRANKKVLLITHDDETSTLVMIKQQLKHNAKSHVMFNLANKADIDSLFTATSDVLLLTGISANHRLENFYIKYHLERWKNKIIFICPQHLLHSRLDPSIYFVPMKFNRPQKHLFTQLKLKPTEKTSALPTTFFAATPKNIKISEPLSFRSHFLNQQLLTKDQFMMQMLADRVQQDENFKALLFKLVLASRNDERMQIAAANAITVLNYAKISFAGMNLSRIKIPSADLSEAILDHTDLSEADLTHVSLRQAFINNTNFNSSCMNGVEFGEESYFDHDDSVDKLAFSSDGQWLATASKGLIYLWDWPQRKLIKQLQHNGLITCVQFSPDNQFVIAGSYNYTIRIWDFRSGKLIHTLSKHSKSVTCIKCSPNNKWLVSGGDNEVILWDLVKGQYLDTLPGKNVAITSVDISADSRWIIAGSLQNTIKIWDIKSLQLQCTITTDCGGVTQVRISPQGDYVIVGGQDNSVILWKIPECRRFRMLSPPNLNGGSVTAIEFSSTADKIVSTSFDNVVKCWDSTTGELLHTFQGHTSFVTCGCFSPNDKFILSGSFDKSVRVWNLAHSRLAPASQHYTSIHFSANGKRLLISTGFNFSLINPATGQFLNTWQPTHEGVIPHDNGGCLGAIVFIENATLSPDGGSILWTNFNDLNVHIADAITGKIQFTLQGHTSLACCANFSPSGTQVVTGSSDKTVKVWNIQNARGGTLYGHTSDVMDVCYSRDEKLIASIEHKGTIHIWNAKNGDLLLKLTAPAHSSLEICPGSRFLLSINKENLLIWDMFTGKLKYTLTGHTKSINSVSVSTDGNCAVTGSSDHSLRIWYINTGMTTAVLHGHNDSVDKVCFNPANSNQLVSLSHDGSTLCWDFNKQHNHWSIKWRTHPYLFFNKLDITNVSGLSENNKRLIHQRDKSLSTQPNEDEELIRSVVASFQQRIKP